MRLPVIDDEGKMRWAMLDDSLAGAIERPLPLETLLHQRANVVLSIAIATHGARSAAHLSKTFGITPNAMAAILGSKATARQINALERAFQNALQRVKVVARP